jgi:alpha-galactosidase
MQRRNFLRLTGFSAAALLSQRLPVHAETASGGPAWGLQFPSAVAVWRDGAWQPLGGRNDRWSLGGLSVDLRQGDDAMKVRLHAPGIGLQQIRLTWKKVFPANASYTGDAWERSYGDLAWLNTPSARAPWYMLVSDEKQTHAFGVRTGANSLCFWQAAPGELSLVLDLHSGGMGVELGDRVLDAAHLVATQSLPGESPFHTEERFCKMMCGSPRLPAKPVYGINDWYFAYGKNSKELILSTTAAMAELATDNDNRPFSVIDDGWEDGSVFTRSNSKFGDMSKVAAEIKRLGMHPGLWTRPLLANAGDPPARLISRGKPGQERYLDPTQPENLRRIAQTIGLYNDWGFRMVKHDYSTWDLFGRWGSQMGDGITTEGWSFSDRSKTNAEIIGRLYATIREAAGDMYLIGCNTVSHLSAGVFELNRIGDDTSGREWDRVVKMGVNTMGFRLPQHNAFYAVDGDCVGLTTQIPWRLNRQWMQLLAESGAPLFISAQPEATGPEQKEYIKKCFAMTAKKQPTGEPLDWMTNSHPEKWKLNGRVVNFDWSH